MTQLSPPQKLAASRLAATRLAPYLSAAILNVTPRKVPPGTLPMPTMAMTDTGILVYEEAFVAAHSPQELGGVLVHEILHWLRDHGEIRRKTRDPEVWNLAADAEINDDLVKMRLPLPGKPILPSTFGLPDGLLAEEYYARIVNSGPGGKGKAGAPAPGVGAGQCGACAGNPLPGEPKGAPAPGAPGTGPQAPGAGQRTPSEVRAMKLQVAAAVKAAAGKQPGSVPLGLARWADLQLKAPKVPWRAKLARVTRGALATAAGAVDLRYSRISRRQGGIGFGIGKPMLPAYVAPRPEVAFAFDTSGSMSKDELELAATEADAVMKAVGAKVTVISCDAQVHSNVKVGDIKAAIASLKGGGGTDFEPIIEAVLAMRPRPQILVIATDGCGPVRSVPPPGLIVIWLLIGRYKQSPCTWGEQIEVEDE